MSKFNEVALEAAIIELFIENDYDYINGEKLHRKYDEVLLLSDLNEYLKNRYPELSKVEIEKVINKINLTPSEPLYKSNRNLFFLVNEGFDLVRDDIADSSIHIDYIDFDNPQNNIFKVINQFTVMGERERRPDMLVSVNGIPVAIFEFKTAIKENVTIYDAWKQIHIRYNRDISNLTKYCFLSVISDGANTKMGSIFTPYEYYYAWNKVNDEEKLVNGISALKTLIDGVFTKERLVEILRDFIYYPDKDNLEKAIVTRYPQFFAATKMLENIKKHLKPIGDGKGGTYFGATGSGKTNTMLFLARLLATHHRDIFQSPTIIILVDREDLSNQTSELFESSKRYLKDNNVKSIKNRAELTRELTINQSGGVYICTIQKFSEETGLLSERNNIICISDEAHRTQLNTEGKLKKTDRGIETSYGFAHYLHDAFPNATYSGFTGTPIDETIYVFGEIVEQYTMKESADDGITVRISYEPRLARVIISEEQAGEIDKYYKMASEEGANPEQIEESKKAMSQIKQILMHPDRIKKVASDIALHYMRLVAEKPAIVQKAMIVTSSREHAYLLYQEIKKVRPDWFIPKKTEMNDLTKIELEKLIELPKVNLVGTRDKDDAKDMFEQFGDKAHRQMLEKQFKNNKSNFQIAIVVDMWITGFDVPSLTVMYNDKPLKKHTLIQTISRVNRVFEGKDKGLVVDYIGIRKAMLEALKKYSDNQDNPIDNIEVTLAIFKNQLSIISKMLVEFDATKFYLGTPSQRLMTLNLAAEFVQKTQKLEIRFMNETRKLKKAYEIVFPSGELTSEETEIAQFYLAIRSIIYKQIKGDAPDTEIMNRVVQQMVYNAITSTGVEDIINNETDELFSQEVQDELAKIKMPNTKFKALLKLLKQQINAYSMSNKIKAVEFSERLKKVVEAYNNRDAQVFVSEVVSDFVDDLSEELINIMKDLIIEAKSFESLGISYEEKAFYDILIKVRNDHDFEYSDDNALNLAKSIKKLVEDKAGYADWSSREDIKNQLRRDLVILLHNNGYPPQWNNDIFEKVLEQAENFKKFL